ncbi:MAG TPA: ribosome silencing factor [Arachidicoccus sp.]
MATKTSTNKVSKLTKNSKLLKVIIQSIQEKKGENILSLDLRNIAEAIADFFIVCEASSTTQVKAIADNIEEQVKLQLGEPPFRSEGRTSLQWVLVDYINVVIHIMLPETRERYKLEDLWFDAPEQKFED